MHEESNWNKYLTLVPTDESKGTVKKYKELWNKTRDLIRWITNNLSDYNEKYMKIKFNPDEDLHLKKTLEFHSKIIVVRSVFYEGSKYYPQVFLDECFFKLAAARRLVE